MRHVIMIWILSFHLGKPEASYQICPFVMYCWKLCKKGGLLGAEGLGFWFKYQLKSVKFHAIEKLN